MEHRRGWANRCANSLKRVGPETRSFQPVPQKSPAVRTARALQAGALSPADRGDGLAHEPLELDAPRTGPGADGDGVQNSRSQHGQNRWVVLARQLPALLRCPDARLEGVIELGEALC